MKLRSFRVTNYRCIDDSGEVPVDKIKVLVGKNESGKTSILRALHKFNPTSPEPYNGLKEFPRRRFHEYDDKARVVEVKFSLLPNEKKDLTQMDLRLADVTGVSVSRDYAGNYAVSLLPQVTIPHPTLGELEPFLGRLRTAIDSIDSPSSTPESGPSWKLRRAIEKIDGPAHRPEPGLTWKLFDAYGKIGEGIDEDSDLSQPPSKETFTKQVSQVIDLLSERETVGAYKEIRECADLILRALGSTDIDSRVHNYVIARLPTFIYFENYGIIAGRIHLPSFVQKLKSGQLSPEEKTARALFSFVKLDPEKLVALGSTEGKSTQQVQDELDTRALQVDRARLSLSGMLAELWKQRRVLIDFVVDGDYLRLWVMDNVDGSKIELEQRSKGFQWFMSFYIVFMTESEGGNKDAILLLDEPGLHLHAAAQEDLLKVLSELSERNTVVYSTHSPFMIDLDALDKVATLVETREGTKVSDPTSAADKDALYPLQAALAYSISQSLFPGESNLVVEGITDFWFLSTISQRFRELGLGHIDDEIVISPAGGAAKAALLSAMLTGKNTATAVLLNSSVEGAAARNELLKGQIVGEGRVVFVGDASLEGKVITEVEDLLPISVYLGLVNKLYSKELGKHTLTDEAPARGVPIRRYAEAEFEKRSLSFSRFRVATHFMSEFSNIPRAQLPDDFVKNMERLFSNINKVKQLVVVQPVMVEAPRSSRLRTILAKAWSG